MMSRLAGTTRTKRGGIGNPAPSRGPFQRRLYQKAFSLGAPLVTGKLPFFAALFLKLTLIAAVIPQMEERYFLPFFEHFLAHPSWDPWGSFLKDGGTPLAFPYGLGMLLIFLPLLSLHSLLPLSWSLGLTLLGVDLLLFKLLCSFEEQNRSKITTFYWLSPLALFVSFIHGQFDLIPTALLIASLYFLKRQKPYLVGAALGWAVSAKLSVSMAVPFLLIFLWRNHHYRHFFLPVVVSFLVSLLSLFPHAVFSKAFQQMVFSTPEMSKIYALKISLSEERQIYLVVVTYLLTLYAAWLIRRMNSSMLHVFLGVAFSIILLFTDAPIGWFLWLLPFFTLHYAKSSPLLRAVFLANSIGLTCWGLLTHPTVSLYGLETSLPLSPEWGGQFKSLFSSFLLSLQALITLHMAWAGIRNNDYFFLSRKPLSIAIAGDSGVGKDSLVASLTKLFGARSIATLAGDNYHRWDRHSQMWKYATHLQWRANRLQEFSSDALALIQGREILSPYYNHATGRFSRSTRVRQNDLVLLNGLHAFVSPLLRQILDLKIYLEMDERLRRFFKLRRDTRERGHLQEAILSTLERRKVDKKFIEPQKGWADLVFFIAPEREVQDDDWQKNHLPALLLKMTVRNGMYSQNLARGLIGICGLSVQIEEQIDQAEATLSIVGEPKREDLAALLPLLAPQMKELIALEPVWEGGIFGLMQLVCALHIQEKLLLRRSFV